MPDLGITLLFIFFWVRSLNSGDLEYLQVKGPVLTLIRRKKSFMLSGNAGEAETIHSEDEPISEVIVGSEHVKNVLTDSDAANLDVAIALKLAYAVFEGSCSATNQQLHIILGDRCAHVRETKDSLLACLRTFVTEVETKVKDAEGLHCGQKGWASSFNQIISKTLHAVCKAQRIQRFSGVLYGRCFAALECQKRLL